MVDFRITYTLSMQNQPPKSPPDFIGMYHSLGGLHEAWLRGTTGKRLHIYIVRHIFRIHHRIYDWIGRSVLLPLIFLLR